MMDFLFGVIGFAGFEALRIYKCLWAGYPVLPINHKYFYLIVVVVVALFSGAVATVISHGSVGEAIYVGFSVPTGIKALIDRPSLSDKPKSRRAKGEDHTDDITLGSPRFDNYVMNHYFAFR